MLTSYVITLWKVVNTVNKINKIAYKPIIMIINQFREHELVSCMLNRVKLK